MKKFFQLESPRETLAFLFLVIALVIPPFLNGGRDSLALVIFWISLLPLSFFILKIKGERSEKTNWGKYIFFPYIIFLVIILVSFFISKALYNSLEGFFFWLSYFLVFWISFEFIKSRTQVVRLSYLLLALAFILSIVGLIFFAQSENYQYLRLVSTFYHHNAYGGFLLLVIPLSLSYFLLAKERRNSWLFGILSGLLLINLILSHSRGSWAVLIVVLIIMFIFLRKRFSWLRVLKLLTLMILVAVVSWGFLALKSEQAATIDQEAVVSQETAEENAYTARVSYFKGVKDIFLDNPVLGTGFNSFGRMFKQYQNDLRFYSIDPHNFYLKTLSELGIIGVIALGWLIVSILIIIFRLLSRSQNWDREKQALILGFSAGIIGALVHLMVDLDWQFPANAIIFWFLVGGLYKIYVLGLSEGNSDKEIKYQKTKDVFLITSGLLLFITALFYFLSDNSFQKAQDLKEEGELTEAVSLYESAVSYNPLNPVYHRNLGIMYFSLGKQIADDYLKMAQGEAEKALRYSSHDDGVLELFSKINTKKGEKEKARENLEEALVYNPLGNPRLYLELTAILAEQGKHSEIIGLLEEFMPEYSDQAFVSAQWLAPNREEIKNQVSDGYNLLGISYTEVGQTEKARGAFERALELNPSNISAQENLNSI